MNILEKQQHDEVDGTFCYELFEHSLFKTELLHELLSELPTIAITEESSQAIAWIISSVDTCFLSHHDDNDLYTIKNYTPHIEFTWKEHKKVLASYLR